MLDAATLREEIAVHVEADGKLKPGANREYVIQCLRQLRRFEDKERNDVPRSPVTGY